MTLRTVAHKTVLGSAMNRFQLVASNMGLFTVSISTSVCDDANKWVQLTPMKIFTFNMLNIKGKQNAGADEWTLKSLFGGYLSFTGSFIVKFQYNILLYIYFIWPFMFCGQFLSDFQWP